MSTTKIFISYSRDDRAFVEKLVDSLRSNQVDVWFDYHLLSGQDWDDALENQIKDCTHMVIVLSETSVASNNVKNEMRYALDIGKHLHPILKEPCSVPLSMRRMHYIDFENLGYNAGLERLVGDINKSAGTVRKIKRKAFRDRSKPFKILSGIFGVLLIVAIVVIIWKFWPTQ